MKTCNLGLPLAQKILGAEFGCETYFFLSLNMNVQSNDMSNRMGGMTFASFCEAIYTKDSG